MLEDTPQGYATAAAMLSTFAQDIQAEMAYDVLDFLSYRLGSVDTAAYHKRTLEAGASGHTQTQTQSAINVLILVFRECIAKKANADDLAAALKGAGASVWSSGAIKVLKRVWAERGEAAVAEGGQLAAALNIGRLADLKWKLGLSVASNDCRNLSRAFVAVELQVADAANNITSHNFEMSISEFQNFLDQLREMKGLLETT